MADNGLNRQSDIEELSAWMDGELSGPRAERVARLVATDPDWQAAFEQFRAVWRAMDLLAPPAPPEGLAERIVRSAHRQRRLARTVQIAAPLAAAACIILALWLGFRRPTDHLRQTTPPVGVEARIAVILKDVPPEDRFIVRNLPLFRDYPEVARYREVQDLADAETLSALMTLENEKEM